MELFYCLIWIDILLNGFIKVCLCSCFIVYCVALACLILKCIGKHIVRFLERDEKQNVFISL